MKEFEHGGNIHKALRISGADSSFLDFSANINPLGPPPWLRPLISSEISNLIHYPDPEYPGLVAAIADFTGVSPDMILVGNGTTELLFAILKDITSSRVVIPVPSYVDYTRAAELAEKKAVYLELKEEEDFSINWELLQAVIQPGDILVIGNPNNPTGIRVDKKALLQFADINRDCALLVDEAFIDFSGYADSCRGERENIITLRSMTKFYGVPGLRLGYAILSAERAASVRQNLPPWSVNTLAAAFGEKALRDKDYQLKSRKECRMLNKALRAELAQISAIKLYPSQANYLFIKLFGHKACELARFCFKNGILIRECDNYKGLKDAEQFIRIAVKGREENQKIVFLFKRFFGLVSSAAKSPSKGKKRKKCPIMFQGTCSDAGKSILTAALCRVLARDGLSVAPFKAQNMSLNSFVTMQGEEMGRAQVVQAQASFKAPDCRMNPVLLKPNSDTGSQVIVQGKPVGNMSVFKYNDYKRGIWNIVCGCYDELAAENDVVILEGAGSPGEVNLKKDDIVNMRMAAYANASVLLVGDIDRGGVYSSFVGIMEVLEEWERQLVAGFVVNKFRGHQSLLQTAHDYVKAHTGKNVIGVLPFIPDLGLPEEDSVAFRKGIFNKQAVETGVTIAVLCTPHISNFTDVEPFLGEPDITLVIAENPDTLDGCHAVILPGSKNVIADLKFIKEAGFDRKLAELHQKGCEIVGICGGYQMLGEIVADPYAIESSRGTVTGLGFMNIKTVIEREKKLVRKKGHHLPSGIEVLGYEIHHGLTSGSSMPLLQFADNSMCGSSTDNGQVWGAYLHGIFDSDSFRRWFIDGLRSKAGLEPKGKIVARYDIEKSLDRLADYFCDNMDMKSLYKLLNM